MRLRCIMRGARQMVESEVPIVEYKIVSLERGLEEGVINIIKRNLDSFEEAGSVLASSFRRLESFFETYSADGSHYFVVVELESLIPLGGAGIGPMAGLPVSEGIGEIRELVIDEEYRRRGFGGMLLSRCISAAAHYKYKRIYLETTRQMEHAQRLFRRFGFNPVEQHQKGAVRAKNLPCYYMMEGLDPFLSGSS